MNYNQTITKALDKIGKCPAHIVEYYVYNAGTLVATYTDYETATNKAKELKGVMQDFISNRTELDAYKVNRSAIIAEIQGQFLSELRAEYSDLDDVTFNLVYAYAYEDGHSAGYDEVAIYVGKYAEFANKVLGK